MKQMLLEINKEACTEIEQAETMEQIEEIRIKYSGKKGKLTQVLRKMGNLSSEERPVMGKLANEVRADIEKNIADKKENFANAILQERLLKEKIDVTLPGKIKAVGHIHPLTQTIEILNEIFIGMGYCVEEGPEVELPYYNFDALNTPEGHPARDENDTFYFNKSMLLRTQTSSVQIRVMENTKPPIRIVCPGRVYRSDEVDATHSPMFHQYEGLVIDKNVTMGDLIGTLKLFASKFFGPDTDIRLRPHHFPFTEPSAEVDVTCWNCKGKGCRVCKNEGWIEILGAGMVHPSVLKNCNIDSEIYSGFAFGVGIERITMARNNIKDLRMFLENDIRFLSQF